MEERILGRTGLRSSCIGFGAIPIIGYPEKYSIRIIQKAIDLGINYIDTAREYGDTEAKIGKAIKGKRDRVIIVTKTHLRSFAEASESIEESLRQLRINTIDVLHLHGVDDKNTLDKVLSKTGSYRAVEEAQESGKIRYIGISGHNPAILIEAVKRARFDMILAKFSLTNQDAGEKLFPLAKKLGIGISIMKSLDGGLLAIPKKVAQVDIHGESMGVAQGAVMFALANTRDFEAVVIVGLGTNKEMEEIVPLGYKKRRMDDKYIKRITELAEKLGKGFCLQCGYCKPYCPKGIDIPFIFKAQIYREKFGIQRCTIWTPESIKELVDKCVACGKCMPRCPNKLEIPVMLKKCVEILCRHKE